ncbi:MAG: MBL fold metallo-hydrolase [Sphingobacterium sp.]|nr:MBL fold metallo-hydrolase [Sphingobacterium sp.]
MIDPSMPRHGLAYFVETTVDDKSHSFMFDFGLDYQGIKRNMQPLQLDVSKIEALGLSHGHFDHWGSLLMMLKDNKDRIKKGIPFYVGGEAFSQRYADMPPGPFDPVSGLVDLGMLDQKRARGPGPSHDR